jgi:integrase
MFCRENFEVLCEAIEDITVNEDKTVKSGSRVNLYYLLLKSIKKLRDRMFLEKIDNLYKDLRNYCEFFKSNEAAITTSARYFLEHTNLKKTRRPAQLPLEEDIKLIHSYTLKQMNKISAGFEFSSASTFIEVRNLVMTRLTLFNGRRGGEVGRLLLEEWMDGERDGWIDKQRLAKLSPADKVLANSMKMVYLPGKGNRHLVSIIVPNDTVGAMNLLADESFRKDANVDVTNNFLFASTQQSTINFSGWHALKNVCGKLPLQNPDRINATNNRHRVSTIYASLDIPEKDREIFYTHMGHSQGINKDVYQSPLALMGLTKLGPNFMLMNGK